MTTHLRRHIDAEALLYPEQLANALRRQEIYGGSLDTALLELELVDPLALAQWLQAACGLAPVPVELLVSRARRPYDVIGVELMRLAWVIPLAREGGRVQVAVHPDLPDDRLGLLYRSVSGLQPMVAPECCLEALRAEWQGSVVPQRYAVLSVAYMGALRKAAQAAARDGTGTTQKYRWETGEPGSVGALVEDDMAVPPTAAVRAPRQRITTEIAETSSLPTTRFETPSAADIDAWDPAPGLAPPVVALPDPGPLPERPPEPPVTAREDTAIGPPPRRPPATRVVVPPPPDAIITDGPGAGGLMRTDPERGRVRAAAAFDVPPVRLTREGTLISMDPPVGRFDEADMIRRMAGARAVLQAARSRDAAIEAVVTAAMVISTRVAMFRVRGGELVGLSTPKTALPDAGGKVVPLDPGTAIAAAVDAGDWVGLLEDPDLALALDLTVAPPCAIRRIDVQGRPILVLYIDNPTRSYFPAELAQLDELCRDASDAFEAIVKLRRAASKGRTDPADAAPSAPQLGTGPHADWAMPSPSLRAAYGLEVLEGPAPPIRPGRPIPPVLANTKAVEEQSIPVLTKRVAQAAAPRFDPAGFDDDDALHGVTGASPSTPVNAPVSDTSAGSTDVDANRPVAEHDPPSPDPLDGGPTRQTEELAPGLEVARVTDPPRYAAPQAADEDTAAAAARLTVHSTPPPPPLPPPPPSMASLLDDEDDDEQLARNSNLGTLTGLPPIDPDEDDEDMPAGLTGEEAIIALSSPIDQPTVRGRIELEAEDWASPHDNASESMVGRIDSEIAALAVGQGDVTRLHYEGDAAFAALAARLPGPLELLRRDMRALPPPSAHGPLIRSAIAAGPPIVPFLLELVHHPNPDVRFYAAYIFQELRDDRCAPALANLAFDANSDVRVISMRVLETYSRAADFRQACAFVRSRLDADDPSERLHAARAVGTLRDVEAVWRLIDLLASKDRFVQEASIESLCSITGQQLGLKPHRWKSWYVDNRERHRIEWIIESLHHKDMPVRQWAAHELSRITGHRIAFSPVADKRARDSAVRAWMEWWNGEGKSRLGADRARL